MYASHYGFNAKPFSIVPNPNIIFLNENYKNALSYMKYGLREKVGFILLTGEIGAGKTTMIRYMLNAIEDQIDFAVIFNTNFSSEQLLRLILSEFEIPLDSDRKERHIEQLYEFLIDRFRMGRHVLLIIDEAQNLSDDALEDIRMLSNLQTNEQILIQIMLVGQPELKKRLASPTFCQLAQRIAVSYHLPPLTEDQTHRYVAYRIETVGGQPDIFTPEAIKLIHDNSGGIPRTINLLCDAALVYGFADDLQHVDRDTVELVLADQVCILDPNCHANQMKPSPAPESPDARDDLRSRMSLVERTLSNLQWRVEEISREVKNELLFKYQELLISERNRYDQLKKEYDALFQRHAHVTEKPMIWQRIVNFHPLEKLSSRWTTILGGCKSLSTKARRKYEQSSVRQMRMPAMTRWVNGIDLKGRMTPHWLPWSVVCLILISFISVFFITRQPMTANIPGTKPFENGVEAEPGPTTGREKENAATVISTKENDAEPQEQLETTFQETIEKKKSLRHIVRAGDTLSSIARAYQTNVDAIVSENRLQNYLIYIGQILKIPPSGMEGSDRHAG